MHHPNSCAFLQLYAVLGVLLVAACSTSEELTSDLSVPERATTVGAIPASTSKIDLPGIEAFELSPEITGTVALGGTITVSLSARAKYRLPHAHLRIQIPELLSAQRGQPDLPSGQRISPLAEETRAVEAGETVRLARPIVLTQPGYFRVLVSAVADLDGTELGRTGIQGTVHRELWVYVSKEGGQVTATFEPERLPEGFAKSPGVLRPAHQRGDTSAATSRLISNLTSDGQDHYRLVYYDADSMSYLAVPNGVITYTYFQDYGAGATEIGSGSTISASDGSFAIPCDNIYDNEWYDAEVASYNTSDVNIIASPSPWAGGGSGGSYCGVYATEQSPLTVTGNSAPSRVFVHLQAAIPAVETFFGTSRGQVDVSVLPDTSTSYYSKATDEITIYGNAIWGSYGRFTGVHEFGHALFEKAMGGDPMVGACPSPHSVDQLTSFACALSEGWADYVAASIGFGGAFNFESSDYTHGCTSYSNHVCTAHSSTQDGSVVEGAVTGTLLNFTDAHNDAHDSTTYAGKYIADLLKTCTLYPGILTRVVGVDHLVYCMEGDVSSYVATHYFFGRSVPPYSVIGESATEPYDWNLDRIRQIWLWNLYRQ